MEPRHDHAPQERCTPPCPGWGEGALQLFALQRRYAEMLEACREAAAIEYVVVATQAPGVELPSYLDDELVRLNLVVGRDTPEVLLDEWGIRCTLTFRGRRQDVALPWPSVLAGGLRPPKPGARARARFAVIEGGKKD